MTTKTEYKLSHTAQEIDEKLNQIGVLYAAYKEGEFTDADGKSAYELACDNGFDGTLSEWLDSLIGESGKDGVNGTDGEPGYTPVKGVDYYTEADKAEIQDYIQEELANNGQQKIEFANSIEECTNTSNLYVLPDGYLYAWMETTVFPFINQIPISINPDGSPFIGPKGEIGYDGNLRIALTNQVEEIKAGVGSTGYIRVNKGDTIYFKNYNYYPGKTDIDASIQLYNSEFSEAAEERSVSSGGAVAGYHYLVGYFTTDESGKATSCQIVDRYNNGIAYIRVCGPGLDSSTIVTVNEEITDGVKTYAWVNTGHTFNESDYEDRIIELEKCSEDHEARIKTIETNGSNSASGESVEIPEYIKTEAEDVIDRLIEVKENAGRCFTIVGLSDFHYYNYDSSHNSSDNHNRRTLIQASNAINYIINHMHIDAVATLGDMVPFGETDSGAIHYTPKYFREMSEILSKTQQPGVVDFRAVGNHDRAGGDTEEGTPTTPISDNTIYSYIGGYNRQCDYLNAPAGYGYKDFEGYKLRVIVLNTAECEGKGRFSAPHHGYFMGNAQYNWLINKALDMSSKEDASEWQILLLSHHRADDVQVGTDQTSPYYNNGYILPNILNAYKTGTSYTATISEEGISVSCDFAGKNQAALIGQIHGHHHNYKYQKLYIGSDGSRGNSIQTNIMAVGTPTTSFIENGNADNDGNTYTSERDTAKDTAFCVYNIDLDNHKIHAVHYGNGVDREISY